MELKTSADLGAIFTEADDLSLNRTIDITRRIRNFDTKKLMRRDDLPADNRGTAQFDVVEACKARIFSALTDFGFEAPTLEAVSRAMELDQMNPALFGVRQLPDAIRNNETWILRLVLLAQKGGLKTITGGFAREPDMADDPAKVEAFDAMCRHQGFSVIGSLTLDVTMLCEPVVAAYGPEV